MEITDNDVRLINSYSSAKLGAEDVYVFTVTLCDNETDRDGDRFTADALAGLAELYKGVSGIFDHDPRSENQKCRVYDTFVETVPGRTNSAGEPYARLRAKCYTLRTLENEQFIREIEGGIKKEVSVCCAMGRSVCSVCGADFGSGGCRHIPGVEYDGEVCVRVLSEPTDAYEWSFVAVPAQKAAGVTKSAGSVNAPDGCAERLKTAAADGERYRKRLAKELCALAAAALPSVPVKTVARIADRLSCSEIEELTEAFSKYATGVPQTAASDVFSDDRDYLI